MTEIDTIRKRLRAAGYTLLSKQLRKFAKGDANEKAALRPMIEKSIDLVEKARSDGR